MARTQNPNLEIIEIAAQAIGSLRDELVFLGGCATALLITDSAAPPVRALSVVALKRRAALGIKR